MSITGQHTFGLGLSFRQQVLDNVEDTDSQAIDQWNEVQNFAPGIKEQRGKWRDRSQSRSWLNGVTNLSISCRRQKRAAHDDGSDADPNYEHVSLYAF